MILVDVLLSDKLIDGVGGITTMTVLLTEDELIALLNMTTQARLPHPDQFMFIGGSGCLLDTRCVLGLTPAIEEEEHGGGGLELEPDGSETGFEN